MNNTVFKEKIDKLNIEFWNIIEIIKKTKGFNEAKKYFDQLSITSSEIKKIYFKYFDDIDFDLSDGTIDLLKDLEHDYDEYILKDIYHDIKNGKYIN